MPSCKARPISTTSYFLRSNRTRRTCSNTYGDAGGGGTTGGRGAGEVVQMRMKAPEKGVGGNEDTMEGRGQRAGERQHRRKRRRRTRRESWIDSAPQGWM
eukprot:763866-Hanusia_phi.AAC.7